MVDARFNLMAPAVVADPDRYFGELRARPPTVLTRALHALPLGCDA